MSPHSANGARPRVRGEGARGREISPPPSSFGERLPTPGELARRKRNGSAAMLVRDSRHLPCQLCQLVVVVVQHGCELPFLPLSFSLARSCRSVPPVSMSVYSARSVFRVRPDYYCLSLISRAKSHSVRLRRLSLTRTAGAHLRAFSIRRNETHTDYM